MMKETKTIILAAGKGTRMKSDRAKVLHKVCGRTLLEHVITANRLAGVSNIAVIVGYQGDAVAATLPDDISVYEQTEQLGTGHAVAQALPFIEDFDGNVLILVGDAPLVRPQTLDGLIAMHDAGGFAATVLTANFDDPTGYGRVVKHGTELIKIVEQKDASPAEQAIHEINSGMYCFDAAALRQALSEIKPNNAQGEYYLTDSIEILRKAGKRVGSYPTPDAEDIAAVNSKTQLAEVGTIMRKRINARHTDAGVLIIDPAATYIDADVVLGKDAVIYPGCVLEGKTVIGPDAVIEPHCYIVDGEVGAGHTLPAGTTLRGQKI